MNSQNNPPIISEPPLNPDDTHPTGVIKRGSTPRQQLLSGLFSVAAVAITVIAAGLYIQDANQPVITPPTQIATSAVVATNTTIPTAVPTTVTQKTGDTSVPSDVVAELLMQPGDTAPPADKIFRGQIAYTIAPVSVRSSIIQYTVQTGDDLDKLATKFGIAKETIIGNNDIVYVNRLFAGDTLTILPEDGILYKADGNATLQQIADHYKVNPYAIIDSEYNKISNASPSFVLPEGITVFVPGGVGDKKLAYWNPGIQVKSSQPTNSNGTGPDRFKSGDQVEFGGGPGSCGFQPNVGNPAIGLPMPAGTYTIVRGFSATHSGIDLADPIGTPVFAAGTGTVIFAGWSDYGFGYSIVITHGSIMTIYGHLSRIGVTCGQQVTRGAQIGAVGSTGNSTGPHLHFEIRVGTTPVNPVGYLSF